MRRKRCPYCKSLNTVPCMAATKEGRLTMTGQVCDDCDLSFSMRERMSDGTWVKVPDLTVPTPACGRVL